MRAALPCLFGFLVFALAAAGCGSPAESTGTGGNGGSSGTGGTGGTAGTGGTGGTGGAQMSAPVLRFFTDERPQDSADKEVETDEARWGDPIRIVVEGLPGKAQVRVDISTGAWGVFTADDAGTVDLGRDAPQSGTWTKADIDGPFWSAPVAAKPIFDITVTVSDAPSKATLVSKGVHRRPVNVGVDTMKVADGTRVGVISRPPDDGTKRPAILAFGGSEGGTGTGEFLAYYLSQLGYVSFGVGYFGAAGLPANLEQVPLELLKDDLDFLASQPDVDPQKIAVLGGSRGGELALLLGAHYPDVVHAVIAEVPSGYVWGATTGNPLTAWTLNGMDLPFMPSSGVFPGTIKKNGKTYYVETPVFLADIAAATPAELEAARTPVELAKGPIFMAAGEDDQLWPSCVLSQVAWDALVANGHDKAYADEMHCYPSAGHFISFPPGSSTLESDGYYDPGFGVWILVGGTPEGIAAAERQGNTAMRGFLDKAFGAL